MTQTTVSGGAPSSGNPPPVVTPPTPPPAIDASALQRQIDDLKTVIGEKDQAIQNLSERVNSRPPKQEAAPPADDEDETDVLDLLTSKGSKGLEKLLEKKGFVRSTDVDQKVNQKAEELAREQQLLKEYPDLGDKSSDFFKATAQHYGNLVKSGVAPSVAMSVAAERTELAMIREGKILTPQQKKDAEKKQQAEERRARAAAQAGDRGTRTPQGSEDDDELTDEQRHIAKAMGITEDAYKARAKSGVAMRGQR